MTKYTTTALLIVALLCSCASTDQGPAMVTDLGEVVTTADMTAPTREWEASHGIVTSQDTAGTHITIATASIPAYSRITLSSDEAQASLITVTGEELYAFLSPDAALLLEDAIIIPRGSFNDGDEVQVTALEEDALSILDLAKASGEDLTWSWNAGQAWAGRLFSSTSAADAVLQATGAQMVINLSPGAVETGTLYEVLSAEGSVLEYDGSGLSQVIDFIMTHPGPIMIVSTYDDTAFFELPIMLTALMGARTSQIEDAFRQPILAATGLSTDGEAARLADQAVEGFLSKLAGGSMPSDALLLSLSTDWLNQVCGLSFSAIPGLRLALR